MIILHVFSCISYGACTGSGLTWSCASGSSSANVQSAVNSASDGATITLANGTYSISGVSLNNRNGISIVCASVGGCTITASGDTFTNDFCSGAKTNLMRISGFQFTGSAGTAKIWLYCNSNMSQVRIDNNTFTIGASEIAVLLGELSATGKVYGVMDHNTCTATNNFMCLKNISGGSGSANWVANQQGGANAFFFENNTCNFTNNPDLGTGCVDVWRANSTVLRFNTLTNARFVNHSYCHEGPYNSEIYKNTINDAAADPANYRAIHFQGSGEEIAWGNTVEINAGGDTIVVQHFRGDSSTATSEGNCNSLCNGTVMGTGADAAHANDGNRVGQTGYPCWHQPGRDVNAALRPVYSFMNASAGGTRVDMVLNSGQNAPGQFSANRDYYNGVSASAQSSSSSPFDGTSGVGFGTIANRPTTCTTTGQAADAGNGGVAYWATDEGSWNSSGSGGQGRLYVCTATNTWTLWYTPYTFPHPLAGGGSSTGPVNASGVKFSGVTLK